MLIHFYGDDLTSLEQGLNQQLKRYRDKYGESELVQLEANQLPADRLADQLGAAPLFSQSRLIVIKNYLLSGTAAWLETTWPHLTRLPSTTFVILVDRGLPDRRSRLFKALSDPKTARQEAFLQPTGLDLKRRLATLAKAANLSLTNETLHLIWQNYSQTLLAVASEFERFSLALSGQILDRAQFLAETTLEPQLADFALTDAIYRREGSQLLTVLERERRLETASQLVVGSFSSVFYQICLASLAQSEFGRGEAKPFLINQAGLKPYPADLALQAASRYRPTELKQILAWLYQIDRGTKQGWLEPWLGLLWLARLLNGPSADLERALNVTIDKDDNFLTASNLAV